MCFGCMLWDELPETVATHWGVDNQPNGYSSRAMAVYGMPLIMLAFQCFLVFMTELDIKKKNHSPKMITLMLWVIPLTNLMVSVVIYASALGMHPNVGFWALLFLGILFMFIGNYTPKCRQNWTMGIRTRWTLSDADNWYHTHRLAWPVWMAGGFIVALGSFFSSNSLVAWGIVVVFALMVLIPTVYSYLYYKQHRNGDE